MKEFLGLNKQYLVSNYLYFKKQTNLTKLFLYFIAMIDKNTKTAQQKDTYAWNAYLSEYKYIFV